MRRVLAWTLLVAVLAAGGCRKAQADMVTDLLYVDEVEAPARAPAGQDVIVKIGGSRPDPSWEWDRNEVSVVAPTVTVSVYGRKTTRAPVAAVLIPFTTEATLSGLPAGKLTLVVRGKQREHTRTLEVFEP